MTLNEAKREFVTTWGKLSTEWGASKSMGLIQGLLLTSSEPICSNRIMEILGVSRGSVNMSINSLIERKLVHKVCQEGERKDFFIAEKDPYKMFLAVLEYRKKKELDPMLQVLNHLKSLKPNCAESQELCNTINNLHSFSQVANTALENLIHTDPRWLTSTFEKNK